MGEPTAENAGRPRDHLDDVFDRFGEPGTCEYCGADAKVRPEPFGRQNACKPCWDQIIGGDDD